MPGFGGGVYSYFNFVSWLGKINFVISLLYMCALILPYAFVQGPDSFDKTAPVNRSAEWKEAINCSDTYKSELQSYIANRTNVQKVIDILQGTVIFSNFQILMELRYFGAISMFPANFYYFEYFKFSNFEEVLIFLRHSYASRFLGIGGESKIYLHWFVFW